MNLPNKLTVSRFVLTVVFLWALFWPWEIPFRNTLRCFCSAWRASRIFSMAASRVARALITNFGILMDPLADKIMTCSAFIAFVESTHLNPDAPVKVAAWMVVIIVARELAITGLRLLAASKNIVLAAERYGKHKTISQIVCHHRAAGRGRVPEWPEGLKNFSPRGRRCSRKSCLWITVALTATSGMIYLWRNRALYLDDM
jgi:CDP-diacylglycerol--glycerol-3-phosphate 3-phosphatidyltransferase